MNFHQTTFRQAAFRIGLWLAVLIFVFDFNFYRYGIDIRLGQFVRPVVARLEKEASQNITHWKTYL